MTQYKTILSSRRSMRPSSSSPAFDWCVGTVAMLLLLHGSHVDAVRLGPVRAYEAPLLTPIVAPGFLESWQPTTWTVPAPAPSSNDYADYTTLEDDVDETDAAPSSHGFHRVDWGWWRRAYENARVGPAEIIARREGWTGASVTAATTIEIDPSG